ncbi:MAG TPA: glycosyltransferase family 2 protein [Gemmatimonadales bacterium]|nr:glycosyltransferase family 2 protein [Gemmatimonadales bacterium]
MSLFSAASLILFLVVTGIAVDVVLGLARLQRLVDTQPRPYPGAPPVSIVVAARDEARGIEQATRSLLAQQYPGFEVIAVDDRSTDQTGAILDRLGGEDPRLRVIHIKDLPEGWLGKNHALSTAAQAARGEWLLFTDADVVMEPRAVARAVGFCERDELDHLAVLPEVRVPGILLQGFVTGFVGFGLAAMRPWKVRDPASRRFGGVGAFNLVRASAYRRVGGHTPIRLRPDDDLKLGKILKRSGARSDVVVGNGAISVEWYHSIGEAVDGLMKNAFSVVQYRPLLMILAALVYLVVGIGPLVALLVGPGPARIFGLATMAVLGGVLLRVRKEMEMPRRSALVFPVVCLLLAWIVLRALVLTLSQGGIVWRGTFYPLEELRKNRV